MTVPVTYKTMAVDAVRTAPPPATPTEFIRVPPFTANCSSDHVGHPVPLKAPNYCAYFGANATFDFFLQVSWERSYCSSVAGVSNRVVHYYNMAFVVRLSSLLPSLARYPGDPQRHRFRRHGPGGDERHARCAAGSPA
jgi:hypothetical protein